MVNFYSFPKLPSRDYIPFPLSGSFFGENFLWVEGIYYCFLGQTQTLFGFLKYPYKW